jgi:hypothetical protein
LILCAIPALLLLNPSTTGLKRLLDIKTRVYSVHLSISDVGTARTLDYRIRFFGRKGKLPPKPGEFAFALSDLDLIAGEFRQHQPEFGAGDLTFKEYGLPTDILPDGWVMMPLLPMYLPDDSTVETAIPVKEIVLGRGWKYSGSVRLGLVQSDGQSISFLGTLTSDRQVAYQSDYSALIDLATGWLTHATGAINGPDTVVKFDIKLSSGPGK